MSAVHSCCSAGQDWMSGVLLPCHAVPEDHRLQLGGYSHANQGDVPLLTNNPIGSITAQAMVLHGYAW